MRERTRDLDKARRVAEDASRAKSSFLATMSHEIRTPLNGVLGMAEALRDGDLTEHQRRQVEVITESGHLLMTVIDDILDVSKIEAGRMEVEITETSLDTLLTRIIALFAERARDKGLTLELDRGRDLPERIRTDPTRLQQVLGNLISNAVKFTTQGSVRLTAQQVHSGADGAPQLVLTVTDSGCGLTEEQLGRLFQPFVQADASVTRVHGGSGLGLFISRRLSELLCGTLTLDSAPGEGTSATVVLPLVEVEGGSDGAGGPGQSMDLPELTAALAAACGGRAPRVLVAEDNATNRLVLRHLLTPLGLEVTFAENGSEAVDRWRLGDFDAVLMDAQMPVMSGPEAAKAIRAEESGGARIPILALTANVMRDQVRSYLAAGMDGHVPKPVRRAELAQKLLEVLTAR